MNKLDHVIVPFDNMNKEQMIDFLEKSQHRINFIKIGMEAFYRYGHDIVHELYDQFQVKIFLDLKLHDIPTTVAKAIRSLNGLPIEFLTIHLSGGSEMINKAIESAKENLPKTKLLGVSYLTSLDHRDLKSLWNIEDEKKAFSRLFNVGLSNNIHGIVLSSRELPWLKELELECSKEVLKVCPGIRFQDEIDKAQIQDQKRVETPDGAIKKGATHLVIGRSLTQAENLHTRLDQL